MSTHKNLMTPCIVAVLALGMAACGGNGNGDGPAPMDQTPPPPPTLDFSDVMDGQEIPAGAYTVTGLPDDTPEGEITIPAGMTESFGGVDFTCADDTDCTVTRAGDTLTTTGAFTVAIADAAPVDPGPTDPPPTPVAVDLSDVTDGYMVDAGMVMVPAGDTVERGDVAFTCAAGGEDCSVTVMADGTATSTGGMATAMNSAAYQSTVTMKMNLANQRTDISSAITAAQMAVDAVHDDSTDEQVDAAATEIMGARVAIAGASDVPDEEKAANTGTVDAIMAQLTTAKTARTAAQDAADKEAEAEREAMAATAAKLYAGIGEMPFLSTGDGSRSAGYGDSTANPPQDPDDIVVMIDGPESGTGDQVVRSLSEDKKTTVAANHGWAGKRYVDPAGGDSYEAIVYSNVETPMMGKKFGSADAVTDTGAFEYQLTTGALPESSFVAMHVAFTGVTRTAGTETFHLPDPNPGDLQNIIIPGSYHGVSGTYGCDPGNDTAGCSAAVAAEGFTVSSADEWTFTPGNPDARVMDAEDDEYASYGWWLRKEANDGPFTASAFVDVKGDLGDVDNITNLLGTATYRGGAAGKYALSSSTGGTNDAGHFTARATLEADFGDDMISGTIDDFMGADDQPRNWSVELKETGIANDGAIAGLTTEGTVWTIGDTAADADGQWSGSLDDKGDDDVPNVATGTFYSTYGTAGRMVGGFGATKK